MVQQRPNWVTESIQKSPEISRENIDYANTTFKSRLDCFPCCKPVGAAPAQAQCALCSSCSDHACLSLLHGPGCSQVHLNRPRASDVWGSCVDWKWVGHGAKYAHSHSGVGFQSHQVCSCSAILCNADQKYGAARKGWSSSFSISMAAPGNLVWRIRPLRKNKTCWVFNSMQYIIWPYSHKSK